MEEAKVKRFKKVTEMFPLGFQQDVVAYLTTLERQGFTVQDIKDFHEYRILEISRSEERAIAKLKEEQPTYQCPECPALMLLYPVNTEPGNQTGDPKEKSVWMCLNQECGHTIYNKETAEEILKDREEKEQ